MAIRLAVAGDIHLGKRQYNSSIREKDFRDAWFWLCAEVAQYKPDFFILTGDLFDKKNVNPVTLSEAIAGLDTQGLGLVLAIEGNHDGRSFINKGRSWVEFLLDIGSIDVILRYGDPLRSDIDEIFFTGFSWAGRNTNSAFENAIWEIETSDEAPGQFNIVVAHGFPNNFAPGSGGIEEDLLFDENIDLVLLGHVHRPFNIENRILNPGSLEMTDLSQKDPGGFYIVDIHADSEVDVKFIKYPNRRKSVEISLYDTADVEGILTHPDNEDSILCLKLSGKMDAFTARAIRKVIDVTETKAAVVRVVDETIKEVEPIVVGKQGEDFVERLVTPLLDDDLTFEQFSEVLQIFSEDGDLGRVQLVLEGVQDDRE